MGQRAIPIDKQAPRAQAQAPQAQASQQVSLDGLSSQAKDPDWLSLYEIFDRQHRRTPNDPAVKQLGMALYQSVTTGDYALLRPFKQKYLQAQRISQ